MVKCKISQKNTNCPINRIDKIYNKQWKEKKKKTGEKMCGDQASLQIQKSPQITFRHVCQHHLLPGFSH